MIGLISGGSGYVFSILFYVTLSYVNFSLFTVLTSDISADFTTLLNISILINFYA